jgi:hypothetical protein
MFVWALLGLRGHVVVLQGAVGGRWRTNTMPLAELVFTVR